MLWGTYHRSLFGSHDHSSTHHPSNNSTNYRATQLRHLLVFLFRFNLQLRQLWRRLHDLLLRGQLHHRMFRRPDDGPIIKFFVKPLDHRSTFHRPNECTELCSELLLSVFRLDFELRQLW